MELQTLEEEVTVEDGVIIHAGGADKRCLLSRRVTIGHGACRRKNNLRIACLIVQH